MYYPLGRLNVGGYRGIEAGGDGGNGGRLGHFTQIAWILQIAHTSRNVTAGTPPARSPIFPTFRALRVLHPTCTLLPPNVRLMLCEFVIASNANARF